MSAGDPTEAPLVLTSRIRVDELGRPVEIIQIAGTVRDKDGEAIANTFEDALVYRNIEFFKTLEGIGLAKKFRGALNTAVNLEDLASKLNEYLAKGDKAELAMTLLESKDLKQLVLPDYIDSGLKWLINQLKRKEDDVAGKIPINPVQAPAAAAAAAPEATS